MSSRALVRLVETPQAQRRFTEYRFFREAESRRLVFWPETLPLYPFGSDPAALLPRRTSGETEEILSDPEAMDRIRTSIGELERGETVSFEDVFDEPL
jgi:hypothetical protein